MSDTRWSRRVDVSVLEDDPILRMARGEFARYGRGEEWDRATRDERRYFIRAAAGRWLRDGER